ncbi:MAG: hypothetical protein GY810_01345 [Aureispira sp.]|nr:hypothetical protein [Aureispira sp.]
MDNKQAKQLLSKLDILVEKWLDYFNQKNITRLETHDVFDSAEASYYGIGVDYIDIEWIKKALTVLHLLLEEPQNHTLKNKIDLVDNKFNKLFDIAEAYLDDIPNTIAAIAYLVHRCYKDKNDLFLSLDQDKLNSYTDSAQNLSQRLVLSEQEKKD